MKLKKGHGGVGAGILSGGEVTLLGCHWVLGGSQELWRGLGFRGGPSALNGVSLGGSWVTGRGLRASGGPSILLGCHWGVLRRDYGPWGVSEGFLGGQIPPLGCHWGGPGCWGALRVFGGSQYPTGVSLGGSQSTEGSPNSLSFRNRTPGGSWLPWGSRGV